MNVRAFVGCWPIAQSFAPLRQAAKSNVATDMTDDRVFLTRQPVNARMKETHDNEVNNSGQCFRRVFISAARKELFNAILELLCQTNRQQFKWSSDERAPAVSQILLANLSQPRKLFKFSRVKRISSLFGGFVNSIQLAESSLFISGVSSSRRTIA